MLCDIMNGPEFSPKFSSLVLYDNLPLCQDDQNGLPTIDVVFVMDSRLARGEKG